MEPSAFNRRYVSSKGLPHWHYYLSPENDTNCFFKILEIDEVRSFHSETEVELHSHDFYAFLWYTQGIGTYEFDFQSIAVEPDTLFFVAPMQLHKAENLQNGKGFAIAFSEDFMLHLDQEMFFQIKYGLFFNNNGAIRCKVKESTKAKIETIVTAMRKELSEGKEQMSHISYLAALLSLLLFTIERECFDDGFFVDPKDLSYKTFLEFRDKIEQNFHEKHVVKDYAQMLNVSLSVLAAITQKYAGTTPLKMINMRIILEAKRMLQNSSLRVKEISSWLGFDDPSYFIKFFKRNVGMTPADFREL